MGLLWQSLHPPVLGEPPPQLPTGATKARSPSLELPPRTPPLPNPDVGPARPLSLPGLLRLLALLPPPEPSHGLATTSARLHHQRRSKARPSRHWAAAASSLCNSADATTSASAAVWMVFHSLLESMLRSLRNCRFGALGNDEACLSGEPRKEVACESRELDRVPADCARVRIRGMWSPMLSAMWSSRSKMPACVSHASQAARSTPTSKQRLLHEVVVPSRRSLPHSVPM